MTLQASFSARRGLRTEIVALQVLILVFLAMRLYFDLNVDMTSDEAYYWIWGQRPGWSYFDHPPLDAWLLGIAAAIGGWHPMVARAMTWLTFAGVLLIFRDWSRRLAPEDSALWFWRTSAIYLSTPVFFVFTTAAFHDHLLVFLSLLATHLFVLFMQRVELDEAGATRRLYAAAIALGLAVLTKYNGVFVGLGFAGAFLLRPKLRALLRTPHPWLAALLAVAMQAPVFYWNLGEGLASYRFHLDERWSGSAGHIDFVHPLVFVALSIATLSPFLVWPIIRMLRSQPLPGFETWLRTVAVSTFVASTVTLLAVSVFLNALFYWNIVAFVAVLPLLTRFMQNRWLRIAHFAYSFVVVALTLWNFAFLPFSVQDRVSAVNYDWALIAEHFRAAQAAHPTDMIGSTRLTNTSQLGFALHTINVVKLSEEHSQYDYWQVPVTWAGKSALILVDEDDRSLEFQWLQQHFTTLTVVDEFPIVRFGIEVYSWRIFVGHGFKP